MIGDNLIFHVLDEDAGLNHTRQAETERFRTRQGFPVKLAPIGSENAQLIAQEQNHTYLNETLHLFTHPLGG